MYPRYSVYQPLHTFIWGIFEKVHQYTLDDIFGAFQLITPCNLAPKLCKNPTKFIWSLYGNCIVFRTGPTLWHKMRSKMGSTSMIILLLHHPYLREGAEGVCTNIQAMVSSQIPHKDVLK